MSTMVTDFSHRVIEMDPSGTLVAQFGMVLMALVVVLLLQKEILRAMQGPRMGQWLPTLDVALVPLVVSFGVLLLFRMASLVRFT